MAATLAAPGRWLVRNGSKVSTHPASLQLAVASIALSALGLALAASAQAAAGQPAGAHIDKIIVLPFTVSGGLDEKKCALLNEAYLTELSRVKPAETELISAADLTAILGQMEQKRLAGCSDDSCLVEIGNALGASHMIASSLGKLEQQYVVSTKLVAVNQAKVLHRNTLYLPLTDTALVGGMRQLAAEMAGGMRWNQVATSAPTPVAATAKPADNSSRFPLWPGLAVVAGGALVAAVSGVVIALFDPRAKDAPTLQERATATYLVLAAGGGLALGAVAIVAGGALTAVALASE